MMKKLLPFVLLSFMIAANFNGKAQMKTGYINVDAMVSVMPETAKVDSILEHYKTDSLKPYYEQLVNTYQTSLIKFNDSLKTTATEHQNLQNDLSGLMYQIQNWQQIEAQAVERKQNDLLVPIYKKVYDAIKLVAKEKKYTHVVSKDVFLIAPEADDMLPAVAAKLKVILPGRQGIGVKK
jgi:outer membrane protein